MVSPIGPPPKLFKQQGFVAVPVSLDPTLHLSNFMPPAGTERDQWHEMV